MDSISTSIERDGATFISTEGSIVNFRCKCGAIHHKQKAAICKTSGAYCKDCTSKNTAIKRIKTKIAYMKSIM